MFSRQVSTASGAGKRDSSKQSGGGSQRGSQRGSITGTKETLASDPNSAASSDGNAPGTPVSQVSKNKGDDGRPRYGQRKSVMKKEKSRKSTVDGRQSIAMGPAATTTEEERVGSKMTGSKSRTGSKRSGGSGSASGSHGRASTRQSTVMSGRGSIMGMGMGAMGSMMSTKTGGRSGTNSEEEESSSDEEEPLDQMDPGMVDQSAMPVHLIQHETRKARESITAMPIEEKAKIPRKWSFTSSKQEWEGPTLHRMPWKEVKVSNRMFQFRMGVCSCWSFVIAVISAIVMMTLLQERWDGEPQRLVGSSALEKVEADVATMLGQAFVLARAFALQAQGGLFDVAEPLNAVQLAVATEMYSGPDLRKAQVVGGTDRLAIVRPGLLHDVEVPAWARQSYFRAPTIACSEDDPTQCLGLNVTSGFVNMEQDGIDVVWNGPDFLSQDDDGNALPPENWIFVVHLVVRMNISKAGYAYDPSMNLVALDVSLGLSGLDFIIQRHSPRGGAIFLVTDSGSVLAGPGWTPVAKSDPITGGLIHPAYWDELGLPTWLRKPTPTAAELKDAASQLAPGETRLANRDLVMWQALGCGDPNAGRDAVNRRFLRAIVYSPYKYAQTGILEYMCLAGLGLNAIFMVVFCPFGCCFCVQGTRSCCGACCEKFSDWRERRRMNQDDSDSDDDW